MFNRTASYDEILRRMRMAESGPAHPRKSGVSMDEPRSAHAREATNSSTLFQTETNRQCPSLAICRLVYLLIPGS